METTANQLTDQIEDQDATRVLTLFKAKRLYEIILGQVPNYSVYQRNPSVIVSKQKKFHEPQAIEARRKHFYTLRRFLKPAK